MIRRATALLLAPERRAKIVTFAGTLVPTVLALGVQLVAFAVSARGLGVEAFGVYTALLAIAVIGVELTGWGGADLLVRGTARDAGSFRAYFGNMLLLIAITLPLAVAGAFFVAWYFVETPLSPLSAFLVIAGEILVGRVASSAELTMVAHRHTVRASAIRFSTAFLRLLAGVTFFYGLARSDLDGWIEATFIQSVLTVVLYIAVIGALYGWPRLRLMGGQFRDGGAFCINQASRSAQGNIDRVILGRFADPVSVGLYGAASRILALGLFPLQVVTRMTYANFFIHGKDGMAASRAYALKIAPVMAGVGLASSAAVAAAGFLAPVVLGADFKDMAQVSALLGLSLPLVALQYPAADALTGAGRQGIRATLYMIATFAFGLLMAAGVWVGGTNGLIAAYLGSHALFAAILWIAAFRVE